MTENFKEFKVENHANETWDENNALAGTADYLASIDSASQAGLDINSDLQLAIALQQQKFDQQPQRQNAQQPSTNSSRLVTGPQILKDDNDNNSHRWPIGFVTTGFVQGRKKPVAEAFCEAALLAQLRQEQWNEMSVKRRRKRCMFSSGI